MGMQSAASTFARDTSEASGATMLTPNTLDLAGGFEATFAEGGEAAPWRADVPGARTLLVYTYEQGSSGSASLQILRGPSTARGVGRAIICSIRTAWLEGLLPGGAGVQPGLFYLTPKLYRIGASAFDVAGDRATFGVYRGAKALELLCETLDSWLTGELTPLTPGTSLSLIDSRRLMQARALIEQGYREKLTLSFISRTCGLNRAKLTRGFRELFDCTVPELLSESRLAWAAEQLRVTRRPVAVIGYDAGYNNNASFSRAFSRRFGVSPSSYRAAALETRPATQPAAALRLV